MKDLQDNVVLITGGARRIGAAIARQLHREGARIMIHCRRSVTDAEALRGELTLSRPQSAAIVHGDLRDRESWHRLVEASVTRFGRLDALINNASTFFATPVGQTTTDQWDEIIDSNFKAPYFLAQTARAALTATRGGIINITDLYAERPLLDHAVYCASKAGLTSLTRSLARELAPDIRVNSIAPGAILWPENNANGAEAILDRTPLGRLGEAGDIAQAVVYLLRDAPFTTGQTLTIDGGRSAVP